MNIEKFIKDLEREDVSNEKVSHDYVVNGDLKQLIDATLPQLQTKIYQILEGQIPGLQNKVAKLYSALKPESVRELAEKAVEQIFQQAAELQQETELQLRFMLIEEKRLLMNTLYSLDLFGDKLDKSKLGYKYLFDEFEKSKSEKNKNNLLGEFTKLYNYFEEFNTQLESFRSKVISEYHIYLPKLKDWESDSLSGSEQEQEQELSDSEQEQEQELGIIDQTKKGLCRLSDNYDVLINFLEERINNIDNKLKRSMIVQQNEIIMTIDYENQIEQLNWYKEKQNQLLKHYCPYANIIDLTNNYTNDPKKVLINKLDKMKIGKNIIILSMNSKNGSFEDTNHWVALTVELSDNQEIKRPILIDPMGIKAIYQKMLESLQEKWSKEVVLYYLFDEQMHPQYHDNTYDGGPFLVEAVRRLVTGQLVNVIQQDMKKDTQEDSKKYGQELRKKHEKILLELRTKEEEISENDFDDDEDDEDDNDNSKEDSNNSSNDNNEGTDKDNENSDDDNKELNQSKALSTTISQQDQDGVITQPNSKNQKEQTTENQISKSKKDGDNGKLSSTNQEIPKQNSPVVNSNVGTIPSTKPTEPKPSKVERLTLEEVLAKAENLSKALQEAKQAHLLDEIHRRELLKGQLRNLVETATEQLQKVSQQDQEQVDKLALEVMCGLLNGSNLSFSARLVSKAYDTAKNIWDKQQKFIQAKNQQQEVTYDKDDDEDNGYRL